MMGGWGGLKFAVSGSKCACLSFFDWVTLPVWVLSHWRWPVLRMLPGSQGSEVLSWAGLCAFSQEDSTEEETLQKQNKTLQIFTGRCYQHLSFFPSRQNFTSKKTAYASLAESFGCRGWHGWRWCISHIRSKQLRNMWICGSQSHCILWLDHNVQPFTSYWGNTQSCKHISTLVQSQSLPVYWPKHSDVELLQLCVAGCSRTLSVLT